MRAVYAINNLEKATVTTSLWRGMQGLKVSDDFQMNRRGGTELAPMSTTSDIRVAAHYGMSEGSLLFKLKVDNFMQVTASASKCINPQSTLYCHLLRATFSPAQYGADLQWLSAFPKEAEVLYPPLCYLQPTGREQNVELGGNKFRVVEVVPHFA